MKRLIFVFCLVFFLFEIDFVLAQIDINPKVINAVVEKGRSFQTNLILFNRGTEDIDILIRIESESEGFVFIEKEVSIKAGQSVNVPVLLESRSLEAGIYAAEIVLSYGEQSEVIPAVFGVENRDGILDGNIEVPVNSEEVLAGGLLKYNIDIFNLGSFLRETAGLEIVILDRKGKIVASDFKELTDSKKSSIKSSIKLPEELGLGKYYIALNIVDSKGRKMVTYDEFEVVPSLSPPEKKPSAFLFVALGIIVFLAFGFLLFNHLWGRRLADNAQKWSKKVYDLKKISFSDTAREIRKLEYQKSVLDKAYRKGYIKKASYGAGMRKINSILLQLKKRL